MKRFPVKYSSLFIESNSEEYLSRLISNQQLLIFLVGYKTENPLIRHFFSYENKNYKAYINLYKARDLLKDKYFNKGIYTDQKGIVSEVWQRKEAKNGKNTSENA